MRSLPDIGDVLLGVLVTLLILANGVLHSGVLVSDRPVDLRDLPAPPASPTATAPTAGTPRALRPDELAERDDSPGLPGRFVPAQGRQHLDQYPLNVHVPFCEPGPVRPECYASNPPTSGLHLPVQQLVVLPGGHRLKMPPDPDIYDFAVPREAIPHIEEHAGVYVGYHCVSDACGQAVERLKDLVRQELSLGARVVMSPDPDLQVDTVALASWTRVDTFAAPDYDDARARSFIKAHSCRFDPEHFCKTTPLN